MSSTGTMTGLSTRRSKQLCWVDKAAAFILHYVCSRLPPYEAPVMIAEKRKLFLSFLCCTMYITLTDF